MLDVVHYKKHMIPLLLLILFSTSTFACLPNLDAIQLWQTLYVKPQERMQLVKCTKKLQKISKKLSYHKVYNNDITDLLSYYGLTSERRTENVDHARIRRTYNLHMCFGGREAYWETVVNGEKLCRLLLTKLENVPGFSDDELMDIKSLISCLLPEKQAKEQFIEQPKDSEETIKAFLTHTKSQFLKHSLADQVLTLLGKKGSPDTREKVLTLLKDILRSNPFYEYMLDSNKDKYNVPLSIVTAGINDIELRLLHVYSCAFAAYASIKGYHRTTETILVEIEKMRQPEGMQTEHIIARIQDIMHTHTEGMD